MNQVIIINVFSDENEKGIILKKEVESSFQPKIGEKVRDNIFAEDKEIKDVVYDYANNKIIIILARKEVKNEALNGHIQEVAEMHNWKVITE
ncbi:hypothetical protein ACAG96_03460 [Candidatus Izemoplasma sp. B36]|uniref:hypothetical protein n=1 Tax=Candidatus Izemoplasma sp. B36 TaxID=3242468 RepID=UPI003556258F